ncbi:MAG: hypothetical protein JW726_05465 [Anaerolineales bacterium]|nr:hypothetical protein [Anaerolineales bacterium]
MTRWLTRTIGKRTFLALGSLLVALGSAAWGLSETISALDINTITMISIAGILCGWGLASSHLSGRLSTLVTILLGLVALVFHYGQLGSPLWSILRSLLILPGDIWRWSQNGPPNLNPLLFSLSEIGARIAGIFTRLGAWLIGAINRLNVLDPLAVAILWGAVFWLAAAWACWATFRRSQPLAGILPIGTVLAGVLNYTKGNPIAIAPLIGATLLLMAVADFEHENDSWAQRKVDVAEDVEFETGGFALGLILGLTILAMGAPSLSVRNLVRIGQEIYQAHVEQSAPVAESLGLQAPPPPLTASNAIRQPGLPRSHLIGSGSELSRNVVMVINTGELPPASSVEFLGITPTPYYWRMTTYDIYTGDGWETSAIVNETYRAGEVAFENAPPTGPTLRLVGQNVRLLQDLGGLLIHTGILYTASPKYQIAWRAPVEQGADAFGATIHQDTYEAKSLVVAASEERLRQAGTDYPLWIIERYLQLPETVPERVLQLAATLTGKQPTAYDKARAIEQYLRAFPYTLDIPEAPEVQDITDYFLFDLQQGYCDYYATSMVVMARAAGLPARIVMGYASGSYDAPNAHYLVTEADAHTWIEIYFPGIGWVEFEPTGGRPEIIRPDEKLPLIDLPELTPARAFNLKEWLGNQPWEAWMFFGVSIGMIALMIWIGSDLWGLSSMMPLVAINTIYRRMQRLGYPLTPTRQPGDTPYEWCNQLSDRLESLSKARHGKYLFQHTGIQINLLTRLFVRSTFSQHTPSRADQQRAILAWRSLRWRLWMARVVQKLTPKSQSGTQPDEQRP